MGTWSSCYDAAAPNDSCLPCFSGCAWRAGMCAARLRGLNAFGCTGTWVAAGEDAAVRAGLVELSCRLQHWCMQSGLYCKVDAVSGCPTFRAAACASSSSATLELRSRSGRRTSSGDSRHPAEARRLKRDHTMSTVEHSGTSAQPSVGVLTASQQFYAAPACVTAPLLRRAGRDSSVASGSP